MMGCVKYGLIPTVVDKEAILEMAKAVKSSPENSCAKSVESQVGKISIKVDTGMSRNGCQPSELNDLVMVRIQNS